MHSIRVFALCALVLTACQKPKLEDHPISKIDLKQFEVAISESNYLNGEKFCETYKSVTSKEFGKYVEVPKSYSDKSKGTLKLYVYGMRAFDPKKPSYIYVDGGPGQNSHGLADEYFQGKMNELRFDQRGLGCSAPATWKEYQDVSSYDTDNTVRDMEEIRKAFGIEKWSVHGLSYGSVPATIYGARYPNSTVSVVLEGVVGRPTQIHVGSYKAEKMNLALNKLNKEQRESFAKLIEENSADTGVILKAVYMYFYQERGMGQISEFLPKLIAEDGTIDRDWIAQIKKSFDESDNEYPFPQSPGNVDENVLTWIFCKNLEAGKGHIQSVAFRREKGFHAVEESGDAEEACAFAGVSAKDTIPYVLEQNKISVPVYYFQGSHDGATLAVGAHEHWKVIPQGESYFMLAQRGGHNPNLQRMRGSNPFLITAQSALFYAAITNDADKKGVGPLIDAVNKQSTYKWLLLDSKDKDAPVFKAELEGIKGPAQSVVL